MTSPPPENARIARAGDTFPCGVQTPHEEHLFPGEGVNVYRCAGDGTDTRRDRHGRRVITPEEGSA